MPKFSFDKRSGPNCLVLINYSIQEVTGMKNFLFSKQIVHVLLYLYRRIKKKSRDTSKIRNNRQRLLACIINK
jgi:hypothetical protein